MQIHLLPTPEILLLLLQVQLLLGVNHLVSLSVTFNNTELRGSFLQSSLILNLPKARVLLSSPCPLLADFFLSIPHGSEQVEPVGFHLCSLSMAIKSPSPTMHTPSLWAEGGVLTFHSCSKQFNFIFFISIYTFHIKFCFYIDVMVLKNLKTIIDWCRETRVQSFLVPAMEFARVATLRHQLPAN